MFSDGRKVDKNKTERAVRDSLPPGWRLIRINWKKGVKIHVADPHGRVQVITK